MLNTSTLKLLSFKHHVPLKQLAACMHKTTKYIDIFHEKVIYYLVSSKVLFLFKRNTKVLNETYHEFGFFLFKMCGVIHFKCNVLQCSVNGIHPLYNFVKSENIKLKTTSLKTNLACANFSIWKSFLLGPVLVPLLWDLLKHQSQVLHPIVDRVACLLCLF